MLSWDFLNPPPDLLNPRDRVRFLLYLELLEGRENPAPVVQEPFFFGGPPRPLEGATVVFVGDPSFSGGQSFGTFDTSNTGGEYTADLIGVNGTVAVDEVLAESSDYNLAVSHDAATGAVTLTGPIDTINQFLADSGFAFTGRPGYSGNAAVDLFVRDSTTFASDTGEIVIWAQPVASPVIPPFYGGTIYAQTGPFAFGPGFVNLFAWDDLDGSEVVTFDFTLTGSANADDFTLSTTTGVLTPTSGSQNSISWGLTSVDPVELRTLLDSLVLTPPDGFLGSVTLSATIRNVDTASFTVPPSGGPVASDTMDVTDPVEASGSIGIQFITAGSVDLPASIPGREGVPIDLGGRFVATNPSAGDFENVTIQFSAANGNLMVDPAAVGEFTVVEVLDGGRTVRLTDWIPDLNAFLATPGGLTFVPDAFFSGGAVLAVTLEYTPGAGEGEESFQTEGGPDDGPSEGALDAPTATWTGTTTLAVAPVVDPISVSALDATTDQDTPVGLVISPSTPADPDGSETVAVFLDGVPAGATFNRGADLGNGTWQFAAADLNGLTFTPPPGASGTFTFVVRAVATDAAPGIGLADSFTATTLLTVGVRPAAAPPPSGGGSPAAGLTTADPFIEPTADPFVAFSPFEDDDAEETVAFLADASTTAGVVLADGEETTTRDAAEEDAVTEPVAAFGILANIPSNDSAVGPADARGNLSLPAAGTLFAPAGGAAPPSGYGGERHPLPPVLPLDQTLPSAGFSDAGGDSIQLIDQLYRDAAPPAGGAAPTDAAPVDGKRGDAGPGEAALAGIPNSPPDAADDSVVAASVAGAVALAGLGRGGRVARAGARIRRWLYRFAFSRPHTQDAV